MEAIGELIEPITTNLYAWRVQIAFASIVVVFILGVVAVRAGWLAAARRHPARAAVVGLLGLAMAVPISWYLASPVFLRTSLVEEVPVVAPFASLGPASPSPSPPALPSDAPEPSVDVSVAPTVPPTSSPTPFAPVTLAAGEFSGTDDFHFGSGTASIIELAPGRYHLRLDDFSVRNGPDLFVYLSPSADGWTEDALELGRLKATDGSFGYDLPEGADPARYRSAIIWCKQFSHLFATAPFAS